MATAGSRLATQELFAYHANVIRDHAKKRDRDLTNFQFANDVDIYFTDDGEEAGTRWKMQLR